MALENYYYLLINAGSISIPLLYSFTNHSQFYKRWKALWPAIILTALFFIAWDVIFTEIGIWGFNEKYLIGWNLLGLPLEEWLFFISIPYACVFTYDIMKQYLSQDFFKKGAKYTSRVLLILLLGVSINHTDKLYTFTTFLLTSLFLLYLLYIRKADFMGRFFLAYLIIFAFPFIIVNGILTGMSTPEPIVWYNNSENLGIRIITIPVEDFIYGLLLILMNITIFEILLNKFKLPISREAN